MAFSRNFTSHLSHGLANQGAATEFLNIYNVTTAGTAEASKAVVLDANKAISGMVIGNATGLATGAGAGFTGGTGAVYKSAVYRHGPLYVTDIILDLTGTGSSTTDLDIIGQGASAAYVAKLTAAECGATIFSLSMTCLEAPATGQTDIDLYSATEGTGVFDAGIGTLAETALITSGGAWTNGATKGATVVPLSTEYLYLTCGAGATVGTYTAGKFLIKIIGY